MSFLNEVILLTVVVTLIIASINLQNKVEVNRLFKIKVSVGMLFISWMWLDPNVSFSGAVLISLLVGTHLYTFYQKKIKKA